MSTTLSQPLAGLTRGYCQYVKDVLQQTESICRSDVARKHPASRSLRLLAMISTHCGRDGLAVTSLLRILESGCDSAWCYADLGEALSRGFCETRGLSLILRAATIAGRDAFVWRTISRVLSARRLFGASVLAAQEAARVTPSHPTILRELGDAFGAAGDFSNALSAYELHARLTHSPDAYVRLGNTWMLRDHRRAYHIFATALLRTPGHVELRVGLGWAARMLGRLQETEDAFRLALTGDPLNRFASKYLGRTLEELHRPYDAVDAYLLHAAALSLQRRHDEVEILCSQILSMRPSSAKLRSQTAESPIQSRRPSSLRALTLLAKSHLGRRHPSQAIPLFTEALRLAPAHIPGHVALGRSLQLIDDQTEASTELAWAHGPRYIKDRFFEQPCWDGSPLKTRTLLLWGDSYFGLGDRVQLLRFLPLIAQRGGTLLVECPRPLISLIERLPGVARVVASDAPLPHFDVHVGFGTLPTLLTITHSHAPSYLHASDALVQTWRRKLSSYQRPCIGLCWGGTPNHRDATFKFLHLATLARLGALQNVSFVSLQHGVQSADLLVPPSELEIDGMGPHGRSLDDLAGLILNLDLVITVDTLVAHLAGALGTPVWVLLAHDADARWGNCDFTPLYPNMRLFRRRQSSDWRATIDDIYTELRTRLYGARSSEG